METTDRESPADDDDAKPATFARRQHLLKLPDGQIAEMDLAVSREPFDPALWPGYTFDFMEDRYTAYRLTV
jgi:hypothetical protein